MAIQQSNIKLRAAQVMDDVPEGGGRATAVEIVDGRMNNLFGDWSDTDRVGGRFKLRKPFLTVESESTDVLAGALVVLSDIPADPDLSYSLFRTPGEAFDRRVDAKAYVEAYQHRSVEWHGYLFGPHIAGSPMLQIFQRPSTPLPQPGQTLCLVANEGLPSEYEQYVQCSRVRSETRMYYDAGSQTDYPALVVIVDLTTRLEHPFAGAAESRTYRPPTTAPRIRTVNVTDAARYYGTARLAEAANSGARALRVTSVMTRLAPAAQAETPMVDVQAGGTSVITVSGGARSVDIPQVSHTHAIDVTDINVSASYVALLRPIPAPGTLVWHYRSQGRRYTIRDVDGTGALTGDGGGIIDYTTGSAVVSLLELPDVNTALVGQWSSGVHYVQRTSADIVLPAWTHQCAHPGVEPGSVEIEWEDLAGTSYVVTDNGAGVLGGAGVGAINYTLGHIYLRPAMLPAAGTTPQLRYRSGGLQSQEFTPAVDGNGFFTCTIGSAPIQPGSVIVEWETTRDKTNAERSAT